jgi:hypothetical protein
MRERDVRAQCGRSRSRYVYLSSSFGYILRLKFALMEVRWLLSFSFTPDIMYSFAHISTFLPSSPTAVSHIMAPLFRITTPCLAFRFLSPLNVIPLIWPLLHTLISSTQAAGLPFSTVSRPGK